MNVWDFVEKWYPNYSSDAEITLNDDLAKIIDNEWEYESTAYSLLLTKYDDNPQHNNIVVDYKSSLVYIYEKAILNYLKNEHGKI